MTNLDPSSCPKCGAPIPEGAPQGLCPKCVLRGAAIPLNPPAPSKDLRSPTVAELAVHFPDLELLELIGAGGMGAVYKARQPKLDRLVALKVLSSDLAGDPAFAERFDREARLLARLNHPNIVTVFDSGVAGPFAYLMMEFVDGVNLRQAMKAGRFTPPEALALVQDICAALKFAHEQGILHRDIKPENILIDSRGQVKIADFGIAKLTGEEGQDLLTLTHRGFVLGSPHYMAPEQFESPGDVDQRADIYSLGVVLYELLTGELPLGRFAPPSKKSAVDARIDEIVMRTLERERELRFQTIGEVKTQVQAAAEAKPSPLQMEAGEQRPQSVGVIARHATAAAVCSGVSLLLVPLPFLRLKPTAPILASQPGLAESSHAGPQMLTLLVVALAVLTPLIGTGLGIRALRDIHESSGRRLGFFRSMFGALVWPVLVIFGVTGVLMASAFEMAGSRNDLLFLVLTILVGKLVAALLVSRVAKWAKGGTRPKETSLEATDPTARFANLAPILTTLSLIVGCLYTPFVVSTVGKLRNGRYVHGDDPVLVMFSLLLIVPMAGLGVMFAKRSLLQIREAEGKLAGVTRAKFAALAWPWLLSVLMFGAGIFTLFDENVLGMIWKLSVSLLLLSSSVLGVIMSFRVSRWVRDESHSKPVRGYVWRFVITAVIALICLGSYIGQRSQSLKSYLHEHGATMRAKIRVAAGATMRFQLIRVDAEGKETPLEMQSSISAPENQDLYAELKIVLTDRWKNSDQQKLSATLTGVYSRSVLLDDIWEVTTISDGSETVWANEKQRYEFAIRRDWLGRKVETLYVEHVATKEQP